MALLKQMAGTCFSVQDPVSAMVAPGAENCSKHFSDILQDSPGGRRLMGGAGSANAKSIKANVIGYM